jgi:hypothetical protein
MSHYSVLVIMDQQPTKKTIGAILQPWHEYECTGTVDQYVVDVDITDEVGAEFNKIVDIVTTADGSIHSRWDNGFYTGKPEFELGNKTFVLPPGAFCGEMAASIARQHGVGYATLADCASENFNGFEKNGRFYNRTNPNAKWDWWQIGGRYSGKLLVKQGATALVGERSWTNRDEVIAGQDAALRGSLDFDAMKRAAQDKRREWAEDCCAKAKRTMANLDVACQVAHHVTAKWRELPEPKPRGNTYHDWVRAHGGDWAIHADFAQANWELPEPSPNQSIADWIESAPPLTSWAVVLDNQWFEKGKMSWWAMSTDDKADWDDKFNDLFGLIRDDQWVCVVDCHI